MSSEPERILLLTYSGMNTLDWSGPLEVLYTAVSPSDVHFFEITTASVSPSPTVQTAERATITPDIHIVSPAPDLSERLERYSTLVVPGGPLPYLLPMANDPQSSIVQLIRAFASLPPKDARGKDRVILTVCTGSFFLPATGILRYPSLEKADVQIVTHWSKVDQLQELSKDPAFVTEGTCVSVLTGKRFVDAGRLWGSGENGEGVRLITSGGVSCGLDATLYLVERRVGRERAEYAANRLEIGWRRDEGLLASDLTDG